ncbi:MAG: aldehyde dehydrogenase family protein [Myxococcota bacterium]
MAEQGLIREGAIHGTRPSDDEPLEPVAATPPGEVATVVDAVRAAQQAHAARDVEDRARLLRRFRDAVMARGDALVAALGDEVGKPEAEAWLHEVMPTSALASYWCGEGPELLAAHEPHLDGLDYPGKRAVVERAPRGVVALITPWNFPVAIPLRTLFPALLAGDGVVWKPSEHAPRCANLIAEAAREVYGPDLVRVVHGAGDVGAASIKGGVDAVIFTGSVATGKKVAHAAADALVPASLELGGKDAAVVLDDADVERAARGILWGAMANVGQNCAAVERVYALPKVSGAFAERLAALAGELRPGRDFGPLATADQLATVERHVAAAREGGWRVLTGGHRLDRAGRWYAPTVLTPGEAADAETNPAVVEETFGPVVPVMEVPDEASAIAAANASSYGLTASVWTRNLARGERVARQIAAGVVVVNNHGFTGAIPSLPWTGVRASGYGVTNSPHALDVLTRPRAIVVDARRAKRELWWHPYTPALVRIGRAMSTLRRGGAGLVTKLRALVALLAAFPKRWR